jgi:hypothetical protein
LGLKGAEKPSLWPLVSSAAHFLAIPVPSPENGGFLILQVTDHQWNKNIMQYCQKFEIGSEAERM